MKIHEIEEMITNLKGDFSLSDIEKCLKAMEIEASRTSIKTAIRELLSLELIYYVADKYNGSFPQKIYSRDYRERVKLVKKPKQRQLTKPVDPLKGFGLIGK